MISEQGQAGIDYVIATIMKKSDINKAYGIAAKMQGSGEYLINVAHPYTKDVFVIKNPNHELTEITKSEYKSSIHTNESIIELNSRTEKYYKQLQAATWWIAVATVVTTIATIVNVIVSIYH